MIYRESSPGVNYFDISDRLLIENYTSSAEFHGTRGSRESRIRRDRDVCCLYSNYSCWCILYLNSEAILFNLQSGQHVHERNLVNLYLLTFSTFNFIKFIAYFAFCPFSVRLYGPITLWAYNLSGELMERIKGANPEVNATVQSCLDRDSNLWCSAWHRPEVNALTNWAQ